MSPTQVMPSMREINELLRTRTSVFEASGNISDSRVHSPSMVGGKTGSYGWTLEPSTSWWIGSTHSSLTHTHTLTQVPNCYQRPNCNNLMGSLFDLFKWFRQSLSYDLDIRTHENLSTTHFQSTPYGQMPDKTWGNDLLQAPAEVWRVWRVGSLDFCVCDCGF